jgi:hypothetical protein
MHATPLDLDPNTRPAAAPQSSKMKTIWILSLALIFVLVFCAGFVYFYRRQLHSQTQVASGRQLPSSDLIDESNQVLPDAQLRHGKLILVFVTPDCEACLAESQFLKSVVGKRNDVPFYGVISFGNKDQVLREAREKFPFKVFYDQNFKLAGSLGIRRVPIKLFVEDGTIRKSWGGATINEETKAAFVEWLDGLR